MESFAPCITRSPGAEPEQHRLYDGTSPECPGLLCPVGIRHTAFHRGRETGHVLGALWHEGGQRIADLSRHPLNWVRLAMMAGVTDMIPDNMRRKVPLVTLFHLP